MGEESEEPAQPNIVEHRRRLDDLGGGFVLALIEHAGERVGEVVGEPAHH